jgi:hypothetical protein
LSPCRHDTNVATIDVTTGIAGVITGITAAITDVLTGTTAAIITPIGVIIAAAIIVAVTGSRLNLTVADWASTISAQASAAHLAPV